jgi:uncharacterized membrane protein
MSPTQTHHFPTSTTSSPLQVNVGMTERLASAASGAALLTTALKKRSLLSAVLAVAGGALVSRGLSGHCPVNAALGRDSSDGQADALDLTTAVTVAAPRDVVYDFWRRLENLPRFMEHLREVRVTGNGRSFWSADIPGLDATIEWEAEIVADQEGERLAWRSLPGSDVENAGDVRFRDAPGHRGTEVVVRILYNPPAGVPGHALGKAFGPVFRQLIKEDVRRFKHIVEAGEVPTTSHLHSAHDDS